MQKMRIRMMLHLFSFRAFRVHGSIQNIQQIKKQLCKMVYWASSILLMEDTGRITLN